MPLNNSEKDEEKGCESRLASQLERITLGEPVIHYKEGKDA